MRLKMSVLLCITPTGSLIGWILSRNPLNNKSIFFLNYFTLKNNWTRHNCTIHKLCCATKLQKLLPVVMMTIPFASIYGAEWPTLAWSDMIRVRCDYHCAPPMRLIQGRCIHLRTRFPRNFKPHLSELHQFPPLVDRSRHRSTCTLRAWLAINMINAHPLPLLSPSTCHIRTILATFLPFICLTHTQLWRLFEKWSVRAAVNVRTPLRVPKRKQNVPSSALSNPALKAPSLYKWVATE